MKKWLKIIKKIKILFILILILEFIEPLIMLKIFQELKEILMEKK